MFKNFDEWNKKKKRLEYESRETLPFHEREIWWCSIGINIGDEQDGKNQFFERPVLVIKKFNNKIAWVLPMTSKQKENEYFYNLQYNENSSSVILSQLRLISVKRFRRFIRKISPDHYREIVSKLINFLEK